LDPIFTQVAIIIKVAYSVTIVPWAGEKRNTKSQKDGRRKRGAEGLETAASLLLGTRARDGGGRQNRGKTGLTAQKMSAKKGEV
jgi:hypothetical protein